MKETKKGGVAKSDKMSQRQETYQGKNATRTL